MRELGLDMVEAALAAVEPRAATERVLARAREEGLALDGAWIVALGKAAAPMAEGAVEALGSERGIVITPQPHPIGSLDVRLGEHPVSGRRAIDNGEALLALAREVPAADPVVCLVSGGGSAMADAPAPGIEAGDLVQLQEALLASGAPIDAMNLLRRRASRLKGGGFAAALSHARVVTVVLSDTPGHPPSTVASGPTIAPETEGDVEAVLREHRLASVLPASILAAIRSASPKPASSSSQVLVAADNGVARGAAAAVARDRGVEVDLWTTPFAGEARALGPELYGRARRSGARAVVAGGESTVTLRGSGRGGRNHEILLGAVGAYEGGVVLGLGTDGVDGSSGAAGALLDGEVIARALARGLDVDGLLEDNDSARYFQAADAQIVTGPTGTNVADLWIYVGE
jgi:hydroxypyruvate reductase